MQNQNSKLAKEAMERAIVSFNTSIYSQDEMALMQIEANRQEVTQ